MKLVIHVFPAAWICLVAHSTATPSLILTPTPGWNGWMVEGKVTAGFREHGGAGEDLTSDTETSPIAPFSLAPGAVVSMPAVTVARTPDEGASKDKAEGTLTFSYNVGTAATPDTFTFSIDGMTSATTAKHDFGAGRVPADAVFECELKLTTYAPLGGGSFITIPAMPALTSPASETMVATIDAPVSAFRTPGMPALDMPVTLTAGEQFIYTLTYTIVTPYGEDPPFHITLTGGAGAGSAINVVPNGDFEITGPDGAPVVPGTPVTTTAATPSGPSAAASWQQSLLNGTFMTTMLMTSTNTLAGTCGNMIQVTSDGVHTGSSASQLSVNLPVELPVGSEGALDINVVKGSVTAAFAVNTATDTVLDTGYVTTGPTAGWTHLRFKNLTTPTTQIQLQIAAPPGDVAEVYIDSVSARAPKVARAARYDYPAKFVENWISSSALLHTDPLRLAGDFNGDGLDDLIQFFRNVFPAETGHVHVSLNTAAYSTGQFAPSDLWHGYFCVDDEIPGVGDFNGDGYDDIVTFVPTTGKVWVALSRGDGFCNSREWYDTTAHGPFFLSGEIPLVGDFNGDGLADIANFTRGASADAFVAINDGRNFGARSLWHGDFCPGAAIPRVGDATGDGKDDIVCFRRDAPGDYAPGFPFAGMVEMAISNGSAFSYGALPFWHQEFAPNTNYEPFLADVNGDGSVDILAVFQNEQVFAAVNTGLHSFATGAGGTNTNNPGWQWIADVGALAGQTPLIGHFNRDMNSDLCIFRDSGFTGYVNDRVYLCGDNIPDSISRVDVPPIAGPGSVITVRGLPGLNAWWRTRLSGPDGTTLLLPGFVGNDGTSFTVTVPTGCYPSGLYRLLIFETDPTESPNPPELSSSSWPVMIRNADDKWLLDHFSAWERTTPGVSGDASDPDMDGYDNLAEYLFGTNPRAFNTGPAQWDKVGGDLVVSFTARTDRGCIRMTLQQSDNLDLWTDRESFDFEGTGAIGGTAGGYLPSSPSLIELPRQFSRLKFTRY